MQIQPSHKAPQAHNTQLNEVNKMLAYLEKLKSELETKGGSLPVGSQFYAEIQKEVLPLNVRQPHLEQYEGTSDLEDHLAYFLNTLQLHNFSDVIMCKLFTSSLKGVARSWFSQLSTASIKTFSQLASHFRAHFMAYRKTKREYSYLFFIKQKNNESSLFLCYEVQPD